jgi:hypothetical protein
VLPAKERAGGSYEDVDGEREVTTPIGGRREVRGWGETRLHASYASARLASNEILALRALKLLFIIF